MNQLSAFLDVLHEQGKTEPLDFVVFYHRADLDGKCSNEIARHAIDEEMQTKRPGWSYYIRSVGVDYGDEGLFTDVIDKNVIGIRPIVFVLDFSFIDRNDGFETWPTNKLGSRAAACWTIDHHASAARSFEKRSESRDFGVVIINEKKAGCELTWEFFYPDRAMPLGVHLLGRYDVWDHYSNDIPNFQSGFSFELLRPGINRDRTWMTALYRPSLAVDAAGFSRWTEWYERILLTGSTINEYRRQESFRSARNVERVVLREFPGRHAVYLPGFPVKVLLLNDQRMTSGHFAFDNGEKGEKADLYVPFALRDGRWKISFYRSGNGSEVDCSRIAETLGGGGHPGAAGANVTELPEWISRFFPPLVK